MKKFLAFATILLVSISNINAQSPFSYNVILDTINMPGLPGIHSYAFAVSDNKWLIIGGRQDGLHARQPFASFPEAENNTDIFVIDVNTHQFWSTSVNSLPVNLKEQLQSTNTNYYQDADTLTIIGGYAYSASAGERITFPYLTTIQISGLINSIINDEPITPFFKQIYDEVFAVTGGELGKIGNTYYLIGGQRFDGDYNPMGHPTYVQTYTDAIQSFKLNNIGASINYYDYAKVEDPLHLHRRDYNLLPQIFPDGTLGYTISSGVFQQFIDLPFLYPVDITESGHTAITSFNQYLCNYHTAHAPLFDSITNTMHTLFFGGISQYYYNDGVLYEDDNVPFVKTISGISRYADGSLVEFVLPTEMPGFKGASAEFIAISDLVNNNNEIIQLNKLTADTTIIGYILGGIYSPSINPFSLNQTNTTYADNSIYAVKLVKSNGNDIENINVKNPYELAVYPNPISSTFTIAFNTTTKVEARYFISNVKGELLQTDSIPISSIGNIKHQITLNPQLAFQNLLITVVVDNTFYMTKNIVFE